MKREATGRETVINNPMAGKKGARPLPALREIQMYFGEVEKGGGVGTSRRTLVVKKGAWEKPISDQGKKLKKIWGREEKCEGG